MTKAVLFDLYGVLLRNQSEEDLAAIERASGHSGPEFWEAYWACRPAYDAGATSSAYWHQVGERLGRPVLDVPGLTDADFVSWLNADQDMVDLAFATLANGFTVGILSNIPAPLADRVMINHPWLARFAPIHLSGRTGTPKPGREAFAAVIADFRRPASEILFVDDNAANVAAARETGLRAHLFTDLETLSPVLREHLSPDDTI